jgi:hypothetical protein
MSNDPLQQISDPKPVSVWQHKPWWCQPWSIALTGLILISGCWLLFKLVWLTLLVAIPVLAWMGFFLVVYPRLMAQSGFLAEPPKAE